jgi:hypothetical protein
MRSDPEARRAFDLTQDFLRTGIVSPALGELWTAANLTTVTDDLYNHLLGLVGATEEHLDYGGSSTRPT